MTTEHDSNSKREIRHYNGCVKETDMFLLKRTPKKWCIIDSDFGPLKRKFHFTTLKYFDKDKSYLRKVYVDVITGSIYDMMSGQCLSSTRLVILEVLK